MSHSSSATTVGGTASAASTVSPADPGADIGNATPEAIALVTAFFRDKTARDPERFMANFSRNQLTCGDGTLGVKYSTWSEVQAAMAQAMPAWPVTSRAYPTKILGDARSAMVFYVDSPEMFGNEIRVMAPIDFRDGKIVRQVDYWDGRHFGTATTHAIRIPRDRFATDFGEAAVGEQSPAALRDVVSALSGAFATGDSASAADLFTTDATFQDLTLHLSFTGRPSIQGFLDRSFTRLPYGLGTSVRHIVGNAQGGGYEWRRQDAPVPQGVIALELHHSHITRFTTVWDGSLINDATFTALLNSTLEH
jgi:hypothetical protein